MLAHGAGKTEYVPLHTAAAFSSDGADWNTDFIKQGLWVGRISFQITQGFQVLSFTGESPESWREISRHPNFSCEAGLECGKGMLCVVLFWLSLIGAPFLLHALMRALEYHLFHSTGVCTWNLSRQDAHTAWISQDTVETAGLGFSELCCHKYPACSA